MRTKHGKQNGFRFNCGNIYVTDTVAETNIIMESERDKR